MQSSWHSKCEDFGLFMAIILESGHLMAEILLNVLPPLLNCALPEPSSGPLHYWQAHGDDKGISPGFAVAAMSCDPLAAWDALSAFCCWQVTP